MSIPRRTRSRYNRRASALALASVVMVCGACGSSSAGESAEPGAPKRLDVIEASTEDIIDIVPRGEWSKVRRDVEAITDAWAKYRRRAVADGAPAKVVSDLESGLSSLAPAADAEQAGATAQSANDVSGAAVELYGLYDLARPVAIGRLDVIGRQVVLDVARDDLPSAGAQVDRIDRIWRSGLRRDLLERGGRRVVRATDANLVAMHQALARGSAAVLTRNARAFLELVDGMERRY